MPPAKKPPAKKPVRIPVRWPPVPPPKPVVVAPPAPKGLVKALFIGINYTGIPQIRLNGCINDVINMEKFITGLYPSCTQRRVITDDTAVKPTKANILAAIQWLVSDLKPGQNAYFHFSGHGTGVRDTNGDEVSGVDSCICPYNGSRVEIISDDELRVALANKIPAGSKLFAVFDCCSSGTALDLQYMWQCPVQDKLTFSQDRKYALTPGNVYFLSGCQDGDVSWDTVNAQGQAGGAMTFALLETWKTHKVAMKMKHLLWNVRTWLKTKGYPQVPQLSTGQACSSEEVLDFSV
jgi:hypothetical protein